jgi:hypothetical protein
MSDPHGQSSPRKLDDFPIFPYQSHLCHADKQAMLDHAGNAAQFFCECRRVGISPKVQSRTSIRDVGIAISVAAAGWPTFRIIQIWLPHPFALFCGRVGNLGPEIGKLRAGFSQNRGKISILICVGVTLSAPCPRFVSGHVFRRASHDSRRFGL